MPLQAASLPAETAELKPERYAPAGVFISYASEDSDIAEGLYQSLQKMGETLYDRIKVFLDRKSIDPGEDIRAEITKFLDKSDFLIVIYTGLYKKSHGFTGWEVGYFHRLIREELNAKGKTGRKIVALYTTERPPLMESILGISVNVDTFDLAKSRQDYVTAVSQRPDDPDILARLFLEIADRAEARFPPQLLENRDGLERNRSRRKTLLAREIIPDLKGRMFDALSTRITKHSIEQKLIEFEFPSAPWDRVSSSIPEQTKLTQHSGAFAIFGYNPPNDCVTWGQFQSEMKSHDILRGASVLLAIEQALMSAISPEIRLDNDQMIESLTGSQIYRLIVTRQIDYYDGRKSVHLYFIEKFNQLPLGNRDCALIVAFINVAAKYRSIFLEGESPLSVDAFYMERNAEVVKSMTKQLMRELILIEEEARSARLDEASAIRVYFGTGDALEAARQLQQKWFAVRNVLQESAEKVLKAKTSSPDWDKVAGEWLSSLKAFRSVSGEINRSVTMRALDNLKTIFSKEAA